MKGKSSTQRERFFNAVYQLVTSECPTVLTAFFPPNYSIFAVECD